jgi:CHAT domain-containing protein
LEDLQRSLHPDEVILEYVLDEPRSFCLRIARGQARIISLPEGRQQLEAATDSYLTDVRAGRPATASGRRLYSQLLQPVLVHSDKPRLVVVPDGKLNLLPFDSLTDTTGRLVLESHVVTYSPSGTVLYLIRRAPVVRRPPLRFLGIGAV